MRPRRLRGNVSARVSRWCRRGLRSMSLPLPEVRASSLSAATAAAPPLWGKKKKICLPFLRRPPLSFALAARVSRCPGSSRLPPPRWSVRAACSPVGRPRLRGRAFLLPPSRRSPCRCASLPRTSRSSWSPRGCSAHGTPPASADVYRARVRSLVPVRCVGSVVPSRGGLAVSRWGVRMGGRSPVPVPAFFRSCPPRAVPTAVVVSVWSVGAGGGVRRHDGCSLPPHPGLPPIAPHSGV